MASGVAILQVLLHRGMLLSSSLSFEAEFEAARATTSGLSLGADFDAASWSDNTL